MGGSHAAAICLRYAERYPSRVAKLVLFDAQIPDSRPNNHMRNWIAKRKDDPAYAPAVAKLVELLTSGGPKSDEEFQASVDVLLPWYFSDTKKAEILGSDVANGPPLPTAYEFQTNIKDANDKNKLPHIAEAGNVTAKTVILWGGEDTMCSMEAANAIAKGIPSLILVVNPGVGHCPYIEAPDIF